jgi:hypothetical protein
MAHPWDSGVSGLVQCVFFAPKKCFQGLFQFLKFLVKQLDALKV